MPHLIPATVPYEAHFKVNVPGPDGTFEYSELPVIAWDDQGIPWVAFPGARNLAPAGSYCGEVGRVWDYVGIGPAQPKGGR